MRQLILLSIILSTAVHGAAWAQVNDADTVIGSEWSKDLVYRPLVIKKQGKASEAIQRFPSVEGQYSIEYRPVQLIRHERKTDASTAAATLFDGNEMYVRVLIRQTYPSADVTEYHFVGYTDKTLRPISNEDISPVTPGKQRTVFSNGKLLTIPAQN